MEDAARVESLNLEISDISHQVAGRDFRDYTRHYKSAIYGTLHLFADGEEITHTNKLPATFELTDTIRAQNELVETLESTGSAEVYPFCCPCGDRGCAYIKWAVTQEDAGSVSITMKNRKNDPIGETPYRTTKQALYVALHDVWEEVLDFCRDNDIQTFEWAERMETPNAGREYYATTAEIQTWTSNLQELIRS